MKKTPFSKKLLQLDYIIALLLIFGYLFCVMLNGIFAVDFANVIINMGYDISSVTLPQVLDLEGFGVLLGVWIAQLGISSGAYYMMARSDHKLEQPIHLINQLPEEIKGQVDMNELITTVLSTSDN